MSAFRSTAIRSMACALTLVCGVLAESHVAADELSAGELEHRFASTITPLLQSNCLACHGPSLQEAKLDLSVYATVNDVAQGHQTWEIVLERLEAGEMPPEDAKHQPSMSERQAIINWIRDLRRFHAEQNAGDPGVVLARRLSNAEYNYTIRDLTGVDIRPTQTFPVDPANEAGFDNSGESLTMSPALLKKYLEAARTVAEHMVLTPTDLSFAPHPVVTDTDRDKYCVKRIIQFYGQQPTDLATYFLACWQYQHSDGRSLEDFATDARISPRYTNLVWELLSGRDSVGPISKLQAMFRALPPDSSLTVARRQCEKMRDYVQTLRTKLVPTFPDLFIEGNHKGSQPFVLWKNGQKAAYRRKLDRNALFVSGDEIPDGTPPEMVLPQDATQRAKHIAALEQFCSVFPDAFYVSERGRDYLGVAKEKQEKGRLLSAGFHSMMGYYRDDGPLVELILDSDQQQVLDRLWQELNFVASAPARQYVGFLWFERTDSRFMRDPEFDFARAEDKNAASEPMIGKLAKVYLEKAKNNGGSDTAVQAIRDYFHNINLQLRRVESQRTEAEPKHLELLLRFASRAWRRGLSPSEQREIIAFYQQLRDADRLDHEEAVRDSIVSVLMSPHFLYRVDLISSGDGVRRLTGNEVANRLSYFLWSSLPDDELLASLQSFDRESLLLQTRRMLRDAKIRGLATEFAANWLDIRRFEQHNSVDRERFPQFTGELRQAMFEEPIRFFVDLVQNDCSVLALLDADHTFVNTVLADHYGMTGLDFTTDRWIRVEGTQRHGRGGLLPMSVFLTKNAPGLRTSPVKRGYWVVRRLLGESIPPPPPNVPELPADERALGNLTLAETLARHRDNKSCAGCHDRFDTIGLAFEGYGPIGELRDMDLGGRPVDVTVTFPGGTEGSGLDGLRTYLKEHRQQEFVDNLCRKLLSYALGRTLMLSDQPLIVRMQAALEADGYRFSRLIELIVTSRQFLEKRGSEQIVKDL